MPIANTSEYLRPILTDLSKEWPNNRIVNLVCHGHSVPAGYFVTPVVETFLSYPHLLHLAIKAKFPFATMNVIVTAYGGEESDRGALRFAADVLTHKPDVITLDYGLNDRRIGLSCAKEGWKKMIEAALLHESKVILLTPTWDDSYFKQDGQWTALVEHTQQIRTLAAEYSVGLADSFAAFETAVNSGVPLQTLLSQSNHPSLAGHRLVVSQLAQYFSVIE